MNIQSLKAEAETLIKKIGVIRMIQEAVAVADTDEVARLEALSAEIAKLESECSPDDLNGLTGIAARKHQRDLLAKKFSKNSEDRRKELSEASSKLRDDRISSFLFEVERELMTRICSAVAPFCEDASKAHFIAQNSDSVLLLHRHQLALASVTVRENYGEFLDVLKKYLEGSPAWIFNPATETKGAI